MDTDTTPTTQNATTARKVFVKTLGCKVNTFDSHAMANQFKAQGYELTQAADGADITVINTCSVTSAADREARYLIRRYRRDNPATRLIVTGCYAQTDSARLTAMPEVDFVVPNEAKENLVGLVCDTDRSDPKSKLPPDVRPVSENRQSHFKSALTLFDHATSDQTRAFLKIQDGCNGFCAYCLIPYARGASRSVQKPEIVNEVKRLIDSGSREIVLTGIHIGDYGQDLTGHTPADGSADSLIDLLETLFNLPGMCRVRISSLEPAELTKGLVQLLASYKHLFCDHFHLPLQSGHDEILRRMRRTYTCAEYAEALELARSNFPNVQLGADVIPGFPGETDEQFADTMQFIEKSGLHYLHVFPYSARPNTAAVRMPGHLPPEVIKDRAAALRTLSAKLAAQFSSRFIGQPVEVLWEKSTDALGRPTGISRNYLQVVAASGWHPIPGTITHVKLRGYVDQGKLLATPLDHSIN